MDRGKMLAVLLANANDFDHHSMMEWMMGSPNVWTGWGMFFGIFMILFWLLILVALVLFIIWLFKQIQK